MSLASSSVTEAGKWAPLDPVHGESFPASGSRASPPCRLLSQPVCCETGFARHLVVTWPSRDLGLCVHSTVPSVFMGISLPSSSSKGGFSLAWFQTSRDQT